MAIFSAAEFSYSRIDVSALVSFNGLGTVLLHHRGNSLAWLRTQGYTVVSLDCTLGKAETVRAFGRLLRWEEQFGYSLEGGNVSLNALHDGFDFDVPEQHTGCVLELIRPDVAWEDDPEWLLGLLSIASEHSRYHLALGRRFFTLLVLPEGSPLIGQVAEHTLVPTPFRGYSTQGT